MAVHALVMGFGGTGAHILTYLKEIAVLKQGKKPDTIKFLLFDTIANWQAGKTVQILGGGGEEKLAQGKEEGTSLDPASEYYYLQDSHPPLESYVFEHLAAGAPTAKNYPHLRDWLHTAWLGRHISKDKLNIKEGAAQQRQIGRFAMFQNVQGITSYIERALRELKSQASGATINVWILGSAAGGTGAGTLLDAAFMTRLVAARQGGGIQVSGVIVLPDIYSDKSGISNARAYSLFRELGRFQEVDFGNQISHRYLIGNKQFSSEVSYDTGQQRALVESRLFDNLFYLGKPCRNDQDREAFFSSVANAMDPYLDEGQGRDLLQQAINNVGFAASSFGAARLYVPQETYAELFAWEEVYEFLRSITAPKIEGKQANDVYAGALADRQNGARSKVEGLLTLFKELLKLEGKKPEHLVQFAKNTLDPKQIVTHWYQFGGAGLVGLKITPADLQKTVLAYTNPYFSLTEAERGKVDSVEIAVKTYGENKATKGPKEDQKVSRDRFAEELVQCTQSYTSDGKGSFEEGRKLVFEVLSQLLNNKIDALIQDELARNPSVAEDNAEQDKGTAMTRLYQEILWASAEDGPLDNIFQMLSTFLNTLDQEEGTRSTQVVNAANTLNNCNSKLSLKPWVEQPQIIAREECATYILWYQKRGLLKDMQKLVKHVIARFNHWADAFRAVIDDLAISQPERLSALEVISTDHITRLNGRLHRLARNRSALISCQPDRPGGGRDDTMQGYREDLRRHAVGEGDKRLAYQLLSNASWQLSVKKGKPQVELQFAKWGDDGPERTFTVGNELRNNFHQELHDYFRSVINVELERRDIFDYLMYAQNKANFSPKEVAKLLNDAATVLLDTPALVEANWVYKEPQEPNKQNLAAALNSALGTISSKAASPATLHSDRNALTLLKVCKPAPKEVTNLDQCQQDYVKEQIKPETGEHHHDQELFRAQVYHPFRAELEAWYIERRHAFLMGEVVEADKHISPRVARLLEHPDMMQAFVQCIATGVVKNVEKNDGEQIWVFENTAIDKDKKKTIALTTHDEPTADVMRAAVVFVLRQQEARQGSTVKITIEHAKKSAVSAAQVYGKTLHEQVEAFVGKPTDTGLSKLDEFLDDHFGDDGNRPEIAEIEKQNLKMIFQFYGDRNRRTHLGDRMQLPKALA